MKLTILMLILACLGIATAITGGIQTRIISTNFTYCDSSYDCSGTASDLIGIGWNNPTSAFPTYVLTLSSTQLNLSGTCSYVCGSAGTDSKTVMFYPSYGISNITTRIRSSDAGNFNITYTLNGIVLLSNHVAAGTPCSTDWDIPTKIYYSSLNTTHDQFIFNQTVFTSTVCGVVATNTSTLTTINITKSSLITLVLTQSRSAGGNNGGSSSAVFAFSQTPTLWSSLHPTTIDRNVSGFVGQACLDATSSGFLFTSTLSGWCNYPSAINYCKVIPYVTNSFGTSQIFPRITYSPTSQAYPNLFNSTGNQVAYLQNNTVNYVFDGTASTWYSVTPICTDYSAINLVSAYIFPSSSTTSTTLPRIYSVLTCYQAGNNFTWNLQTSDSVNYNLLKVFTNGTLFTTSSTGTTYSGSISILNTSTLNITDGTNQICGWNNRTSNLFSSPAFISDQNVSREFGGIMLIAAAGLTAAAPFSGIAVIFFNDTFNFVNQTDLFLIVMFAIFVSFLVNNTSESAFKHIGWYVGIAAVALTQYASWFLTKTSTSIEPNTAAQISTLNATVSSLQSMVASPDIASFAFNGVPFLISLYNLIASLPAIINTLIYEPLNQINPALGTAARYFSVVIIIAPMVYVIFKMYEMLTRQFKNV